MLNINIGYTLIITGSSEGRNMRSLCLHVGQELKIIKENSRYRIGRYATSTTLEKAIRTVGQHYTYTIKTNNPMLTELLGVLNND